MTRKPDSVETRRSALAAASFPRRGSLDSRLRGNDGVLRGNDGLLCDAIGIEAIVTHPCRQRPGHRRTKNQTRTDRRRRGSAMIVAVVCLLMVTAICFSLVRYAVAAYQQSVRLEWGLQSVWLAESALSQAAADLRNNPTFTGDEWSIDSLGSANETGRVLIEVSAATENDLLRTITVTADFPDDPTDRVRTTRTLTLTLPVIEPALRN